MFWQLLLVPVIGGLSVQNCFLKCGSVEGKGGPFSMKRQGEHGLMPNKAEEPDSQRNTFWSSSGSLLWMIGSTWTMPSKQKAEFSYAIAVLDIIEECEEESWVGSKLAASMWIYTKAEGSSLRSADSQGFCCKAFVPFPMVLAILHCQGKHKLGAARKNSKKFLKAQVADHVCPNVVRTQHRTSDTLFLQHLVNFTFLLFLLEHILYSRTYHTIGF